MPPTVPDPPYTSADILFRQSKHGYRTVDVYAAVVEAAALAARRDS